MATQFSTATAVPQHAPYQHHAYRKSAQYSPNETSSNTPMNVSPTSPRTSTHQLPLQRHQGIYQPRTAIGVPAALRKTERPASKSPPKVDSGVGSPDSDWHINTGLARVASGDGSGTPVSQVGNEDMHSVYKDMPMSPTAGPITRNHWQVRCCSFSYAAFSPPIPLLSRAHLGFGGYSYVQFDVDPSSVAWPGQFPPLAPPTSRALRCVASQHEDRCYLEDFLSVFAGGTFDGWYIQLSRLVLHCRPRSFFHMHVSFHSPR
jgi:hypothetical protein